MISGCRQTKPIKEYCGDRVRNVRYTIVDDDFDAELEDAEVEQLGLTLGGITASERDNSSEDSLR